MQMPTLWPSLEIQIQCGMESYSPNPRKSYMTPDDRKELERLLDNYQVDCRLGDPREARQALIAFVERLTKEKPLFPQV